MFYHEPRSMPVQKRDRKTYQHRKNLSTTNGGSFVDEKIPAGEEEFGDVVKWDEKIWTNKRKEKNPYCFRSLLA